LRVHLCVRVWLCVCVWLRATHSMAPMFSATMRWMQTKMNFCAVLVRSERKGHPAERSKCARLYLYDTRECATHRQFM